ncbi:hypothetical protein [Burkholderia ubonensis]|uniref:hypothetical protein n=1 Tax=Burkholderia ubonensis TaxID=101571 RepID=UPI000AC0DE5A|nr:hypothetical protein [Burkholderia ubonensis]
MANVTGDSASAGVPAVFGENTAGGTGVAGESKTGRGVHGVSESASGVYGESKTGRAIEGWSDTNYGVTGDSRTFAGVRGTSVEGTGTEGWSTDGTGVFATSKAGRGIHGVSESASGVYGQSKTGRAIEGWSDTNYGVTGDSRTFAGVRGTSVEGTGTEGWSTDGTGVFATSEQGKAFHAKGGKFPSLFEGSVEITESLTVQGADVITTEYGMPYKRSRPEFVVTQTWPENAGKDWFDVQFTSTVERGFLLDPGDSPSGKVTVRVETTNGGNIFNGKSYKFLDAVSKDGKIGGFTVRVRGGLALRYCATDYTEDPRDTSRLLWSKPQQIMVV